MFNSYYFKSLAVAVVLVLLAAKVNALEVESSRSSGSLENVDNPKELVSLATKYEHAEGVARDYLKAAALYCKAGKSGYADALYSLGWMYANGRGVNKDDGIAAQLFGMAAKQGHQHAQNILNNIAANSTSQLPACLISDAATASNANDVEKEDGETWQGVETMFRKGPIFELVTKLAPRYEIDPKLALAVISVESGFNVKARSPKNAQGLMQLMPETAQRFRVKNTFDAEDNIKGGLAYLQWLLVFFKGNVALVAAAYNAGERAVEIHRGIPPYPETQSYVRKITALYKKATHPYRSSIAGVTSVAMRPINNSN